MTSDRLAEIQSALRDADLDGWLLYDFRGSNPPAVQLLGLATDGHRSRRWYYLIPASGDPSKLVHQIESRTLDALPGTRFVYARWQELEDHLGRFLAGRRRIAMEYSPRCGNPYVSCVDAGTVELVRSFGVEVVSSGDLLQAFQATLSDAQIASHLEAAKHTESAFLNVWQFVRDRIARDGAVEETAVRDRILEHFAAHNLVTEHSPIVALGPNAGSPHYETGTGPRTSIQPGDLLLVDLWAKRKEPQGTFSDLTRMAYLGESPPEKMLEVFRIVANARDAAVDLVQSAFAEGRPLCGFEVDRACRNVIEAAGYGAAFTHRTGHSIGATTHGNGTHMDDLETHDTRRLLPHTLFSIEPGIYLPEFGVRSETNILIDPAGTPQITGGPLQQAMELIRV